MKKLVFGLVAVTSLVFGTGCGGDVCDDAKDAFESAIEKTEDCPTSNAILRQFKPTDSQVDECKDNLDDCPDSDQDKLSEAYDCIADLPECKESEEEAWGVKFEACTASLSGISDSCRAD